MNDLRKTMPYGCIDLFGDGSLMVRCSRETPGHDEVPNFGAFDEERFRSEFRKGWAEGIAAAQRVAGKVGGEIPVKSPEHVSPCQDMSDEDAERVAEDLAIAMAKLAYGQNPWPERWPVFQESPFEDGPR